MARPMRPSMLLGVTRLHAAIATSTGRIARSLLFTTPSSHVKIFSWVPRVPIFGTRALGSLRLFPFDLQLPIPAGRPAPKPGAPGSDVWYPGLGVTSTLPFSREFNLHLPIPDRYSCTEKSS